MGIDPLLAEAKPRRGEVNIYCVRVVVFFDLTKMLRKISVSDKQDLPLLTLSRAEENDGAAFNAKIKRCRSGKCFWPGKYTAVILAVFTTFYHFFYTFLNT